MGFFTSLLKPKEENTAHAAKERLQLMIAAQRASVGHDRSETFIDPKLMYKIQAEVVLVLEKYLSINRDEMKIEISQVDDRTEVLELNVPILDKK